MKLKLMLAALLGTIAFAAGANASGYDIPVCIMVNGNYIDTPDKPFLDNGITYVPMRNLSTVFSADSVSWNPSKKEATVICGNKTVTVESGKSTASVNGKKTNMNGKAVISGGRMYVPVRFFADTFGAEIKWVQNYYRAEITKSGLSVPENSVAEKSYDDEHIYWLAKIINCESSGEIIDGKIGVGNVILNRVDSKDFPDTIYGVIFDKRHGVQFQPVANGTIYNEPQRESYLAAKLALEGSSTAGNSLYFLNPRIATNFWIPANRVFYKTIGNHDFYL